MSQPYPLPGLPGLTEGHWSNQSKSGLINRPIEKVPIVLTVIRFPMPDVLQEQNMKFYLNFPTKEHLFSCPFKASDRSHTPDPCPHGKSLPSTVGDSIYGHAGFLGFDCAALHSFEITCQLPGCQEATVFPVKCRLISKNLSPIPSSIPYL